MSTMPSLGNTLTPPEPISSRDEIHNALHWLARMTRSFHAPTADNHDVPLIFDPDGLRFLTPEIAPQTKLTLALPDLVLQFEENGALSRHAMEVDEKSSTEIEAWLLCELLHRGFDRERFSKSLPYSQKGVLAGDERKYAPSEHIEELRRLSDEMKQAAAVLLTLENAPEGREHDGYAHHLSCWPENFEIGFTSAGREGAVDLKVGYRPGEANGADAPLFFIRPDSYVLRTMAPSILPVTDHSLDGVGEKLEGMMLSTRVSVAH